MKHLLAGWLILLGAAAVAAPVLTGSVTEVATGDGSIYFQVATATERAWVYGPKADIRLRDTVTIPTDNLKRKVSSKELDHEFRDIYFVADLSAVVDLKTRAIQAAAARGAGDPVGAAPAAAGKELPAGHPQVSEKETQGGPLPAGHPAIEGAKAPGAALPAGHPQIPGMSATPAGLPAGHPQIGATKPAAANAEPIRVAKAEGGKTIAEVYAQKADLAGKEVLVRGKVVKAKANIMNRTWIHIQDGTGGEGSNDLTVTTEGEAPEVGAIVRIRGVVALAKDFGYGYLYPVIVESATVTLEP
jgi:hypothetical protein